MGKVQHTKKTMMKGNFLALSTTIYKFNIYAHIDIHLT